MRGRPSREIRTSHHHRAVVVHTPREGGRSVVVGGIERAEIDEAGRLGPSGCAKWREEAAFEEADDGSPVATDGPRVSVRLVLDEGRGGGRNGGACVRRRGVADGRETEELRAVRHEARRAQGVDDGCKLEAELAGTLDGGAAGQHHESVGLGGRESGDPQDAKVTTPDRGLGLEFELDQREDLGRERRRKGRLTGERQRRDDDRCECAGTPAPACAPNRRDAFVCGGVRGRPHALELRDGPAIVAGIDGDRPLPARDVLRTEGEESHRGKHPCSVDVGGAWSGEEDRDSRDRGIRRRRRRRRRGIAGRFLAIAARVAPATANRIRAPGSGIRTTR